MKPEVIQIVTLAITLIGIVVAIITIIVQSNMTRKQMRLNFFADYTKRYQEIILNFPETINQSDFDYSKLEPEVRDKTLRYMRAYFDLCSEEFYLSQSKRIESEIWEEWSEGIKYTFSKKAFRDAWEIVNLDSKFYSQFKAWVEKELLNS
ncbi:hypothetical protein D1614_22740 [Maribellus luteus]|uniref:DUF4760 domain-containing protein n=1 Tax=Maribellus luteus TaxID=2305463 RepID=A0A399SSQ6_9BACT|nr:hypothetical protein [Maribellus luteus]RIJ45491.1 hypothetical protein D1614_22740 [Maribellus luteus]